MDFVRAFDGLIWFAEIATLTLAAAVLLGSIFLGLRVRLGAVARRRANRMAHWEAIFRGERENAPSLDKGDLRALLAMYDRLRGELDSSHSIIAREHADEIARQLRLDEFALRMLSAGNDADTTAALSVLGKLGDPRALDAAARYSGAEGTALSQTAAEALLRISPDSIAQVLALVRDREDWDPARVRDMLRLADEARLDAAMAGAMSGASVREQIRLLDFLQCCSDPAARSIARSLVSDLADPDVLSAALRALFEVAEVSVERSTAQFSFAP